MTPVDRVTVRDFQSIKDLEVAFGRFTVLVGPSNSGKSAFLRAVRACLRNTFVPANVRAGATKSVITVELDNAAPVTIERGKSLSTYRLGAEAFTKAARAVPDPISKAIGMPLIEGTDLNFSFQFDRPFLLAETGSQVAQVLGSLTNVTLLHEAVRESNRRRLGSSQRLKIRQDDLARYQEEAKQFLDLPQEQHKLIAVETDLRKIEKDSEDLAQIKSLISRIDKAAQLLEAETPEEPSEFIEAELETLTEQHQRLTAIQQLVSQIDDDEAEVRRLVDSARALQVQAAKNEQEYQRVLHEMGVCPTCGRPTA